MTNRGAEKFDGLVVDGNYNPENEQHLKVLVCQEEPDLSSSSLMNFFFGRHKFQKA